MATACTDKSVLLYVTTESLESAVENTFTWLVLHMRERRARAHTHTHTRMHAFTGFADEKDETAMIHVPPSVLSRITPVVVKHG